MPVIAALSISAMLAGPMVRRNPLLHLTKPAKECNSQRRQLEGS